MLSESTAWHSFIIKTLLILHFVISVYRNSLFFCTIFAFLISCNENNGASKRVSGDEQVRKDIQQLQSVALPGDLIVRAGDDLLSQQIKYLNEKDPSYSHAGLIVVQHGRKMVCDIYPYGNGADTIEYIPIDSFLSPVRNLSCALYRYKLTSTEQAGMMQNLDHFKKNDVHFDMLYDLSTDDRLYCSEMIAKVLNRSTAGRITIHEINIPKRMLPLVTAYFKKTGASAKEVADRKYISLDNLYLSTECTLLLRFPLKYFPGQ